MIDASFSMPTDVQSNTTFNGTLTFVLDVTMFTAADITLTAVDGNGITGVTYTVTEQTPSTYSINFTLPSDVEGAFSVEATGMVLPDGESQEVAIVANPAAPIVTYDTSVAVDATWGTPDYTVGEAEIAIPITFMSAVVVPTAAVFNFSPVSPLTDADLEGLQSAINGDGTDWILTAKLPLNIEGEVSVDIEGEVFKVSTHVYDTVTIPALTVDVNTLVPEIIKTEQFPSPYTPGSRCDFVFQFNTDVEFYDPETFYGSPDATILDFFVWSGLNDIGQPNMFVYSGTGFPTLPLPETLPAEWTQWTAGVAKSDVYLMRYTPILDTAEGAPVIEVKANTYYNPGDS